MQIKGLREFRFPFLYSLWLRSSGKLQGLGWKMLTDVWEQIIGTIFKGKKVLLNCLVLDDWTDILSRNVGKRLRANTS